MTLLQNASSGFRLRGVVRNPHHMTPHRYPPVTLLHNASSFHALPALVSGLHETLGAAAFAGNASRPRFAARSHPLPLTAAETVAKDSVLQVRFSHCCTPPQDVGCLRYCFVSQLHGIGTGR